MWSPVPEAWHALLCPADMLLSAGTLVTLVGGSAQGVNPHTTARPTSILHIPAPWCSCAASIGRSRHPAALGGSRGHPGQSIPGSPDGRTGASSLFWDPAGPHPEPRQSLHVSPGPPGPCPALSFARGAPVLRVGGRVPQHPCRAPAAALQVRSELPGPRPMRQPLQSRAPSLALREAIGHRAPRPRPARWFPPFTPSLASAAEGGGGPARPSSAPGRPDPGPGPGPALI